jgi:hypothetical protein
MKFIQRIYEIRYSELEYMEDNNGDRVGMKTDRNLFEFNYDDCIDTYVSLSEDTNNGYVSYEPIDGAISNTIKAYDEILGYYTENLVRAFLEETPNRITESISIQIETVKGLIEVLFQHTECNVYNVDKRYMEYYKYYLEKHKGEK